MEKDIHELLQQYIDKTMSADERMAFETKMDNDPELKKDYQLLLDMEKELGNQEVNDFRNELEKVMANPPETKEITNPPKESFISRPIKLLTVAASVLLLIGVGWWISTLDNSNNKSTYAALSQEYFVPYGVPATRGDQQKDLIYENYKNGNYQIAANELKQYAISNNDNEAKLYAAISFLAINKADDALILLNSIPQDFLFNNKLTYYQGIAYLKKEDKANAQQAFQKVTEADKFLFNKAQEILTKM